MVKKGKKIFKKLDLTKPVEPKASIQTTSHSKEIAKDRTALTKDDTLKQDWINKSNEKIDRIPSTLEDSNGSNCRQLENARDKKIRPKDERYPTSEDKYEAHHNGEEQATYRRHTKQFDRKNMQSGDSLKNDKSNREFLGTDEDRYMPKTSTCASQSKENYDSKNYSRSNHDNEDGNNTWFLPARGRGKPRYKSENTDEERRKSAIPGTYESRNRYSYQSTENGNVKKNYNCDYIRQGRGSGRGQEYRNNKSDNVQVNRHHSNRELNDSKFVGNYEGSYTDRNKSRELSRGNNTQAGGRHHSSRESNHSNFAGHNERSDTHTNKPKEFDRENNTQIGLRYESNLEPHNTKFVGNNEARSTDRYTKQSYAEDTSNSKQEDLKKCVPVISPGSSKMNANAKPFEMTGWGNIIVDTVAVDNEKNTKDTEVESRYDAEYSLSPEEQNQKKKKKWQHDSKETPKYSAVISLGDKVYDKHQKHYNTPRRSSIGEKSRESEKNYEKKNLQEEKGSESYSEGSLRNKKKNSLGSSQHDVEITPTSGAERSWDDSNRKYNKFKSRKSDGWNTTDSSFENWDPKRTTPSRKSLEKLFDRSGTQTDDEWDEFQKHFKSEEVLDSKIVIEEDKDLFGVGEEYSLGHCVAEDMGMGSGIAVDFRRKFKRIPELYEQKQKQGGLAILEVDLKDGTKRYIYYLVTKRISSGKPTYYSFWLSLLKLRDHLRENNVKKLAIPRIGCGLDRLEWKCVKPMLEFVFKDLQMEILVCNFQQDETSSPGGSRLGLRRCKVVNESYPITKIAEETIIIYFASKDGEPTPVMKELNDMFDFMPAFKKEQMNLGIPIRFRPKNKKYVLYGCIVKDKHDDPINFVYFEKCLNVIQKNGKIDEYYYVGFDRIVDTEDVILNEKVLNVMKYSLRDVDIYCCSCGGSLPVENN